MAPLSTCKWPNFYFYDLVAKKQVKVNAEDKTVKFKTGTTKRGHKYYQINHGKMYRFLKEDDFKKLKAASQGKSSRSASPKSKKTKPKAKKSHCRTLKSGRPRTAKSCKKRTKSCTWISKNKHSKRGYCRSRS